MSPTGHVTSLELPCPLPASFPLALHFIEFKPLATYARPTPAFPGNQGCLPTMQSRGHVTPSAVSYATRGWPPPHHRHNIGKAYPHSLAGKTNFLCKAFVFNNSLVGNTSPCQNVWTLRPTQCASVRLRRELDRTFVEMKYASTQNVLACRAVRSGLSLRLSCCYFFHVLAILNVIPAQQILQKMGKHQFALDTLTANTSKHHNDKKRKLNDICLVRALLTWKRKWTKS